MAKTYYNDAIAGNSSLLACFTGKGELVRFFWPNIDYPQHIDRMYAGVFTTGQQHSTLWLHEDCWQHDQSYIKDTNILKTVCTSHERGLKVTQTDFALPDTDVLVRHYDIENIGEVETGLGFITSSSAITTNPQLVSTLFDFGCDALIHYRHGYYLSVSSDREVFQFQVGNNAFESARGSDLGGYESIGMMHDGAVSWDLGRLAKGENKSITIYICASDTLKGVKRLINGTRQLDAAEECRRTERYWLDFLGKAVKVDTGRSDVDALYKRSLLVFKLMSDEKTGGLLAAPEIDEEFTRCGRYAYCWGRDAAFITGALDQSGLTEAVDKFYRWAVEIQDDNGAWQQRYHMDGNLAPSWGLQIDETGTLVWGMLQHYKVTGNKEFLSEVWESVQKAVNFMIGFIDRETGLPAPSHDLWEERLGEHAYSSAAVYGGIRAGIEIAQILGVEEGLAGGWSESAGRIKDAIAKNLWREDRGCFLRSIRTKMNPWGSEYTEDRVLMEVNPKGYRRDFTLTDGTVDVSLLGLVVPFDVFDMDDPRVVSTAETVERVLDSPNAGGIKRYETDNYMGGNPWVISTLWLALYHIRREEYDKAKGCFEWAVKARTGLGLLPEQVNKDTGEPAWVIPLTWSHAMFVLVLFDLLKAGAL